MQFIRRWFANRRPSREAFPCPHCGAEVPGGRRACPACGASEADGWTTGAEEWEGDAEDESEFDYEEFVEREFGSRWETLEGSSAARRPDPKRLILWLVIAAFAATLLMPLFF